MSWSNNVNDQIAEALGMNISGNIQLYEVALPAGVIMAHTFMCGESKRVIEHFVGKNEIRMSPIDPTGAFIDVLDRIKRRKETVRQCVELFTGVKIKI